MEKLDARLFNSPLWDVIEALYKALGVSPLLASEDISTGRLSTLRGIDGRDYIYYADDKREGAVGALSGKLVLDEKALDELFLEYNQEG